MSEVNIIICGVGGQGVVLMSELLGESAVRDGLKVQGSEVLGMAQRGGSVFSNIRLGAGEHELHVVEQAFLAAGGECAVEAQQTTFVGRHHNFLGSAYSLISGLFSRKSRTDWSSLLRNFSCG